MLINSLPAYSEKELNEVKITPSRIAWVTNVLKKSAKLWDGAKLLSG